MWIQLKTVKAIESAGRMRTYQPGDWVDVGKQQALLWLSQGDAQIPNYKHQTLYSAGEAGVVIAGAADELALSIFEPYKDKLGVVTGEIDLRYSRTLIWDGQCRLRRELLFTGFALLDTWQIACPLFNYDVLAANVGGEEEREETKKVIRDLRVPLYDTRLMFVKRCDETIELIRQWKSEWKENYDPKLAFMRAFYRVKPLMLALPVTWITPEVVSD